MLNKVRSLDDFGASISLNFKGDPEIKTLCGGIVSLVLRILIIAFFCMQTLAVFEYSDPVISSY